MSVYREKHYYTQQVPRKTSCCGSNSSDKERINNLEAQLDVLTDLLGERKELKSLGGETIATYHGENFQSLGD